MLGQLITLPRLGKKLVWAAIDFVLLCLALWLAFFIRLEHVWPEELEAAWPTILLAPLLALPVFISLGLYQAVIRYIAPRFTVTLLKAVTGAACLLVACVALGGVVGFPRSVYLLYWIIALGFVGTSRLVAREMLGWRIVGEDGRKLVAIYGAGGAGTRLCKALQAGKTLQPVAFLDDKPDLRGMEVLGCRVAAPADLDLLIARYKLEEVILALPSLSADRKRAILEYLEPYPVVVKTLEDVPGRLNPEALIDNLRHVDIEDLLSRDPVQPIPSLLRACITGKCVLVTGAGGSIGSELSSRIAALEPARLVLLELSEYALYRIDRQLRDAFPHLDVAAVLGSVTDRNRLLRVLETHAVQTVYHAAAYKHVPLVEANPIEGVRNNVLGTHTLAQAAIDACVETVICVSTDKAVRPTNIMGAGKRLAELTLLALARTGPPTRFSIVRFGNVLGSSGSVVPRFRAQIEAGGPVTVTHPEVTRYFMTVAEAAQLVIQAGSMGRDGDIFLLDMGRPVKILDLARKMILLSGLRIREEGADGEIGICFTGLRPGEKLHEELFVDSAGSPTEHPRIVRAAEDTPDWATVAPMLEALRGACAHEDVAALRRIFAHPAIGYRPAHVPPGPAADPRPRPARTPTPTPTSHG